MEINPSEFETDETKYSILKQNDQIRHEIFSDLLKNHLSLSVKSEKLNANGAGPKCVFKQAYFLGKHEVLLVYRFIYFSFLIEVNMFVICSFLGQI